MDQSHQPVNEPGIVELQDVMLHATLQEGRVRYCTYLTNSTTQTEAEAVQLAQMAEDWLGDGEAGVAQNFWLSEALDTLIQGHQWYGKGPAITAESKAKFDALRRELADMIERIDALKFE